MHMADGPVDGEPLAYRNIQLGYALGMGTEIGFKLVH